MYITNRKIREGIIIKHKGIELWVEHYEYEGRKLARCVYKTSDYEYKGGWKPRNKAYDEARHYLSLYLEVKVGREYMIDGETYQMIKNEGDGYGLLKNNNLIYQGFARECREIIQKEMVE